MTRNEELINGMWPHNELTAKQYAAIHLLQPSSDLDWLDDMIRSRMRDDLAARAMQGAISNVRGYLNDEGAEWSYEVADAMLKHREIDHGN
jgi:hypothetical protein